jgi:glyoxylase-like metal-dependent hydrolase (beta-lactamase superfamily II)
MRIADGIEMLTLSAVVLGRESVIHPTLLWDDEVALLVDTGYPGQSDLLLAAIESAGVPFGRLSKIILTHQDIDHIGSLPVILRQAPHKIEVLAGEAEKPYIQGDRPLVKLSPQAIEGAVAALPPGMPEVMRAAFRRVLENPPKAQVDTTLVDGEQLPYCGGVTVVATPGHTPGHISLYHRPSKTLVAGDALGMADGHLVGPAKALTLDMDQAIQSLRVLGGYEVDQVICYHGGLYRGDVAGRLAELVR